MGKYSIKELERLSGIKAHTIRIWEKRYHLIDPERTDTNIRYYSDEDLKKIINVSLLNAQGLKISKIAALKDGEISQQVAALGEGRSLPQVHIDQLLVSMIDLEEESFNAILAQLEKKYGFENMVISILYPFLEKIGILWQTGHITPAHEHFISNLIRQKLISSVAALPVPAKSARRALLFLPEGELHEIALLFFHYVTRAENIRTYYLGQSVPHDDLKQVVDTHRPQLLISSLTAVPGPQDLQPYLERLALDFPSCRILLSGSLLRKTAFHLPKNVRFFDNAAQLRQLLQA